MSRVGKMPIAVPAGRGRVDQRQDQISVKGPGGTLALAAERAWSRSSNNDGKLTFEPPTSRVKPMP